MPEIQGAFFGDCPHPRAEVVMEKRGTHYARRVCSDCRKFLGWIPHPDNVRKAKENAEILTALSKLDNLPAWERQFVRDLVTHKHLSPKQQDKLLLLRDVHLKKKDGVWGIKQEYFDKVYPQQERSKSANDGKHGEAVPPD